MEEKTIMGPENYKPWESGIALVDEDTHDRLMRTLDAIRCLKRGQSIKGKKLPPAVQLNEWRKLADDFAWCMKTVKSLLQVRNDEMDNFVASCPHRSGTRWSKEEDEILIDMVCKDMSVAHAATVLGRTPAAVSSRITELVGVKRLAQDVNGRFVGKIEGLEVEGHINGTIFRGKKEA